MRRILSVLILTITAVCFFGISAHARDKGTVNAVIGVEITSGGTAVIEPGDRSPAPDKTRLTLKDGETGKFNITFSSAGEYDYTVTNVPDERDLIFDERVYKVKIYVDKTDDGLAPTYIVTRGGYKYDSDTLCLVFENTSPDPPEPDKPQSTPMTDDVPTGDTSMTQTAFLSVLAAAAVLLAIPVYMTDRKKKNR